MVGTTINGRWYPGSVVVDPEYRWFPFCLTRPAPDPPVNWGVVNAEWMSVLVPDRALAVLRRDDALAAKYDRWLEIVW